MQARLKGSYSCIHLQKRAADQIVGTTEESVSCPLQARFLLGSSLTDLPSISNPEAVSKSQFGF